MIMLLFWFNSDNSFPCFCLFKVRREEHSIKVWGCEEGGLGRVVSLSRVVPVEVCAGIAELELSFGMPGKRDWHSTFGLVTIVFRIKEKAGKPSRQL